jgi:hypothetical protein
MFKRIFALLAIATTFILTSCLGPQMVGRNTINTIRWSGISLDRSEYVVLDRITATATVTYDATYKRKPKIIGENEEFVITVKPTGPIITDGICKLGYLTADVGVTSQPVTGLFKRNRGVVTLIPSDPEIVARQLAVYRLITEAKAIGADALIEPIISSDVAATRKTINVIKTTVSAKAVSIKTDEEK